MINGSDGNDTIYNGSSSSNDYGNNVSINSYAGDDYIYNYGTNVTIESGDGNDYVENRNSYVTIQGGAGNDYVYSSGESNVSINTGDGDDTIYNSGTNITIEGGAGNDSIYYGGYNSGNFYKYNAGDGNDTINGISSSDTLIIGGASYSTTTSDHNLIIKVGEGSILIQDWYEKYTPVIQGTFDSTAAAESETPAVDTTSSNGETTTSDGSNTQTAVGIGNNNSINGNIVVNNYYDNSTAISNTTIINNIHTYQSGNDTVSTFNSNDTLKFAATYTNWVTDGNDLVINAAEGSVRITQAKDKLIELADANDNLISHVYFADTYEGIIDGRGFGNFEVIIGSDHVSNKIFADTAGSSLWGGRGNSNDDLYGNLGVDEYIYSYGNGNDNISQSGSEDTLNLTNTSLEQISGAMFTEYGTYIKFNDGGSLVVNGQVGTFIVSGQSYQADYQTKTWSAK